MRLYILEKIYIQKQNLDSMFSILRIITTLNVGYQFIQEYAHSRNGSLLNSLLSMHSELVYVII